MSTLFVTDKASEKEIDVGVPPGRSRSELSSVAFLTCFPLQIKVQLILSSRDGGWG